METLVVIAVITGLIVPVILIVAGCKLISAAKELSRGKETQEKMLQALQKIQSELAAFKKDIGSVPVEKKALEKEMTGITLEVRMGNRPAQALYHKYGFKAEGIRKNYYPDTKEDAIIMWKYFPDAEGASL